MDSDDKFARERERCRILKAFMVSSELPRHFSRVERRKIQRMAKCHEIDGEGNVVYIGPCGSKRQRVILNAAEARNLLKLHHTSSVEGHSGINSTLHKISQNYTWNGVRSDTIEYCKTCEECQQSGKTKPRPAVVKSIKAGEPMEVVGLDLIGPFPETARGNQYVLSLVDHYTLFVDFFALPDKTATDIVKYLQIFVYRWGAPKRLLSDQGRKFVMQVNDEARRVLGVDQSTAIVYNRQAQGSVKRTNQAIRVRLTDLTCDNPERWDEALDRVAFSMRTQQQHDSTGYTPFFLMFGRTPRQPFEMGDVRANDVDEDQRSFHEMIERRETMMEQIKDQRVCTPRTTTLPGSAIVCSPPAIRLQPHRRIVVQRERGFVKRLKPCFTVIGNQ